MKSKFNRCYLAVLGSVLLAHVAASAQGDVLFQKSWNGAQLAVDPDVDFPMLATSSVSGGTLLWNTVPDHPIPVGGGGPAYVKFFETSLVPAGTLPANAMIRVTVDFSLLRTTPITTGAWAAMTLRDEDSVPQYDGMILTAAAQPSYTEYRYLQGRLVDAAAPVDVADFSETESLVSPDFELPPAPPIPFSLAGQVYWDFATDKFGGYLPGSAGFMKPPLQVLDNAANLDLSEELRFAFWLPPFGDDAGGIESLALRVETVPEPATGLIACSAMIAVGMFRRRATATPGLPPR
jgi:hypothetical protein